MKKALYYLGLLLIQLIILGFFLVVGVTMAVFSAKSPVILIGGGVLMVFGALFAPIATAIWVRRDVKMFIKQGVEAWIPACWVLVTLFMWFPGFAIYLFLRKFNYKTELPSDMSQLLQ